MDSIKFALTAKLLALVAPFMGKNEPRHYLNAINVRPAAGGGAIIVATDGKAIAYVLDRDAVCDRELTIKVDGRALQACAVRGSIPRQLVLRNGRVAVLAAPDAMDEAYIQPGNPLISGHPYPDVFKLIPDPLSLVPGMAGSFNPFQLRKLDIAATAAEKIAARGMLGDSSPITMWTSGGDPNASTVVRLDRFPDFFAIIMPTRAGEISKPIQPFLADAKAAYEKAVAKRKNPTAEAVPA